MGRIARLLGFSRKSRYSEARADPGGLDTRQATHFSAAGDDSHPLAGDYVAFVDTDQSGVSIAVGYHDPKNAQTAAAGERRIYARDSSGSQICEIWVKNTGEVKLSNSAGYVQLQAAGSVFINGVEFTTSGQIITPEGITLNTHIHSQGADGNGDSEQDTEGPSNG